MTTKQQMQQNYIRTLELKLARIGQIIISVDNRCMCADGDVAQTLDEMTQAEISEIWDISKVYARDSRNRTEEETRRILENKILSIEDSP